VQSVDPGLRFPINLDFATLPRNELHCADNVHRGPKSDIFGISVFFITCIIFAIFVYLINCIILRLSM